MCIETMEISPKPVQSSCVRRNERAVSKMRWKPFCVSGLREDQALKLCRVNVVRTTAPKYLRREQKRVDLVRQTQKEKKASKKSLSEDWMNSRPAGAMAPGNTTQYLMSKVYEDVTTEGTQSVHVADLRNDNLYGDCLSPLSVYAELDSRYESSIDFQTQDFEEVFDQYW